jgi:hypothetical protein
MIGDPVLATDTPGDWGLLWWLPTVVIFLCVWLEVVTP